MVYGKDLQITFIKPMKAQVNGRKMTPHSSSFYDEKEEGEVERNFMIGINDGGNLKLLQMKGGEK